MQIVAALRRFFGSFFRSRLWAVGRVVLGILLGAAALFALNGKRGELVDASAQLSRLHIGWLLVAIVAELISYLEFGQLQRQLLRAGEVDMSLKYAGTMSLAAGALANSFPAGTAVASVYAYRLYKRAGADEALSAWTLVASGICATVSLCGFATVGVFLALRESSSFGLGGIIVVFLVLSILADAIVLQRRWLARVVIVLLSLLKRLTGHPRRRAVEVVQHWVARLARVRPTARQLAIALLSALGTWVFDCGALAASFLAVGVGVPWRGLLLTYGAAQLAVNLPITPGGLGVVEGTITIALVAFGGSERSIVAAVLCYRIVSFWGFLPVGWSSWLGLTLFHRREDRARHPSQAARYAVVATEAGEAQP